MRPNWHFIPFTAALLCVSTLHAGDDNFARLIVGEWQGVRHVRAFYPDGTVTLDPQAGAKPLGRWSIKGNQLTTFFSADRTPMIEMIADISDTQLVTFFRGQRYVYVRIHAQ